jgi:hypothetical protein
LIVIGVHTPEFSFEHEIDRIRLAIKEREIDYPVAVDNDYKIWSAFDYHYWPALYFVDAEGTIREHHFGEGGYEQSERLQPNQWTLSGDWTIGPENIVLHQGESGVLRDGRLYQLIRQPGGIHDRTVEITFAEPGAEGYVFTFG